LSFCHRLPFDRSSMTRWRQRLGEEQLVALIQESLSVAHKTGAIGPKDRERVAVDTTVQPKAVAHPTDARLMHRAITKLVGFSIPFIVDRAGAETVSWFVGEQHIHQVGWAAGTAASFVKRALLELTGKPRNSEASLGEGNDPGRWE
jgi:hypothetical protein